ncbi:hypothetical protein AX774_g2600 [Zancudomyces culisetae]|uniref:Uncharacterized protein n=1 Tax=Zancudomyces culisetae TaxID=1213189 RepID=A0A1R1PSC4_ZANCU|nr:hypothetical protein AX774_g2600 [Zancudomyces culisetae]|eukprot:OMH83885.1 hypothetical protein AX774_g2600 [Zancudomyces culisetae]
MMRKGNIDTEFYKEKIQKNYQDSFHASVSKITCTGHAKTETMQNDIAEERGRRRSNPIPISNLKLGGTQTRVGRNGGSKDRQKADIGTSTDTYDCIQNTRNDDSEIQSEAKKLRRKNEALNSTMKMLSTHVEYIENRLIEYQNKNEQLNKSLVRAQLQNKDLVKRYREQISEILLGYQKRAIKTKLFDRLREHQAKKHAEQSSIHQLNLKLTLNADEKPSWELGFVLYKKYRQFFKKIDSDPLYFLLCAKNILYLESLAIYKRRNRHKRVLKEKPKYTGRHGKRTSKNVTNFLPGANKGSGHNRKKSDQSNTTRFANKYHKIRNIYGSAEEKNEQNTLYSVNSSSSESTVIVGSSSPHKMLLTSSKHRDYDDYERNKQKAQFDEDLCRNSPAQENQNDQEMETLSLDTREKNNVQYVSPKLNFDIQNQGRTRCLCSRALSKNVDGLNQEYTSEETVMGDSEITNQETQHALLGENNCMEIANEKIIFTSAPNGFPTNSMLLGSDIPTTKIERLMLSFTNRSLDIISFIYFFGKQKE